MNREKGGETSRNTTTNIETGKNVPSAMIIGMIRGTTIITATAALRDTTMPTAVAIIKEVMITTAIVDTENALMEKNVTTRIMTMEDTGMRTTVIGDPGHNGTGTQKPIRRFPGTETTTAKMPI